MPTEHRGLYQIKPHRSKGGGVFHIRQRGHGKLLGAAQKWCHAVLAEFKALDDAVLEGNDLEGLAREAPLMAGQFAQDHEGEMSAQEYLVLLDKGLAGWTYELTEFCEKELEKFGRRDLVQAVAQLVRAERSAPTGRVLLARYQVALDGELYRAIGALRKQQEWRLKTLGAVETEAQAVGE